MGGDDYLVWFDGLEQSTAQRIAADSAFSAAELFALSNGGEPEDGEDYSINLFVLEIATNRVLRITVALDTYIEANVVLAEDVL